MFAFVNPSQDLATYPRMRSTATRWELLEISGTVLPSVFIKVNADPISQDCCNSLRVLYGVFLHVAKQPTYGVQMISLPASALLCTAQRKQSQLAHPPITIKCNVSTAFQATIIYPTPQSPHVALRKLMMTLAFRSSARRLCLVARG